jgi:hypothetical protein
LFDTGGSTNSFKPFLTTLVAPFAVAAYLYVNLFLLPNTPILLGGDQAYFWADAQRMLFGELPYRDLFQFTPPGTDFLYLGLFTGFGPRIWVTNALVFVLGMALCWICFSLSQQIMSRCTAFLSTFLFLTLIYGKLLNATHHWFSILLILLAVRVAMQGQELSPPRLAAVGALLGVAAFFTHTHALVALLGCAVMLTWQQRRAAKPLRHLAGRLMILGSMFALACLFLELSLLFKLGIKELYYYQVTFVLRYMVHQPEGGFLGWPNQLRFGRSLALLPYSVVYALVFVTYPWSIWKCWTRRNDEDRQLWNRVAWISVVGSVLASEVLFSLNWLRLFVVSMPAVILACFWLERARGIQWAFLRKLDWTAVIILISVHTYAGQHRSYVVTDLPVGHVALPPTTYEKLDWLRRATRPGDYFSQAFVPAMYLPLSLRSPVYAEGLSRLPQTRPEFVARAIRELAGKPTRYVLWSHYLDHSRENHAQLDPIGPFLIYLHDHYRRAWTFSDGDEVWARQ